MAIPVKHMDCCLYTVVASSLTGESVYVQRTDAMIESSKHYTLELSDSGRAVLSTGMGGDDTHRLKLYSLGFRKVAVCNTDPHSNTGS